MRPSWISLNGHHEQKYIFTLKRLSESEDKILGEYNPTSLWILRVEATKSSVILEDYPWTSPNSKSNFSYVALSVPLWNSYCQIVTSNSLSNWGNAKSFMQKWKLLLMVESRSDLGQNIWFQWSLRRACMNQCWWLEWNGFLIGRMYATLVSISGCCFLG